MDSQIMESLADIAGLTRVQQTEPGVYFLTLAGEVVYVGQSSDPARRISQHVAEGIKQFDDAFFKPVPLHLLDKIETLFIQTMKPRYNAAPGPFKSSSAGREQMDLVSRLIDLHTTQNSPPRKLAANSPPPRAAIDSMPDEAICRLPTVELLTGLKKSALYQLIKDGKFPPSVALTSKARGWRVGEVRQWVRCRLAATAGIEPASTP